MLDPIKGNVAFGCGKDGWAFTLETFARMYYKKFSLESPEKLIKKLWGDHYFDAERKVWTTNDTSPSGK